MGSVLAVVAVLTFGLMLKFGVGTVLVAMLPVAIVAGLIKSAI